MAGLFGITKEERAAANKKAQADWETKQSSKLAEEQRLMNMPIRRTEGGKYGEKGELAPESSVQEKANKVVNDLFGTKDGGILELRVKKGMKDAGVEE